MKKILANFVFYLVILSLASLGLSVIKVDIGFDFGFFGWILAASSVVLLLAHIGEMIDFVKSMVDSVNASSKDTVTAVVETLSKKGNFQDYLHYWPALHNAVKVASSAFKSLGLAAEGTTTLLSKVAKSRLIVPVIILLGIVLRLALIGRLPVTNDEGSYFYDAYLVNQGLVPYRDFLTKSIPHVYAISFMNRLFGNSIFIGRFITVFIYFANSILVYLVAKKIFNRKTAILSLFAFSFYPEIASLMSYAQIQQIQMLFSLVFIYFVIREKYTLLNLTAMAVVIFAAYTTRPTSIVFIPIFLIYLLFLYVKKQLTIFEVFSKAAYFMFVVGLLFGATYTYIYPHLGPTKTLDFFGIETLSQSAPSASQLNLLNSALTRLNNGLSFFRFLTNMPLLLANLFFLFFLGFFKKNRYLIIVLGVFLPVSLFLAVRSIYFIYYSQTLAASYLAETVLLFVIVAMVFERALRRPIDEDTTNTRKHSVIILVWFVMIAGLYAFWIKFNEPYFIEFIPILIFSLGFLYRFIESSEFRKIRMVFIYLLVVSATLSQVRSFTRFYTGTYSPEVIKEVKDLIQQNTTPNGRVMTASLIFPYSAERKVPFDISHPYWYGYSFIDEKLVKLYMPAFEDYEAKLLMNPPAIIVNDKTTTETFFRQSPKLSRMLKTRYEKIYSKKTSFRNSVEVYRLSD